MLAWIRSKIIHKGSLVKGKDCSPEEPQATEERPYSVEFTRTNGSSMQAFMPGNEVDTSRKLARVKLIQRFKKISHVRFSDGTHAHVSNEILVVDE